MAGDLALGLLRLEAADTCGATRRLRADKFPRLAEQFLDDFAAVGDLHRATILAGECRIQRNAEAMANGRHQVFG